MEVKVKLGKSIVEGVINSSSTHLIIPNGVKLDDTININGKVFKILNSLI